MDPEDFVEVDVDGWKRLQHKSSGKLVPFQKGNEFTGNTPNWDFSSFGASAGSAGTTAGLTGKNSEEAYKLLLKYGPQLARSDAMSNLALQRDITPQQLALDLAQAKEFQPQFQELTQDLQTTERTRNLSDIEGLLPALQRIQQGQLDPNSAEMKALLGSQILGDLRQGENLTREQARGAEQGARTAESARGLSGRGSANREAVQKALTGRKLKAERQGAAGGFLAQQASERIDPFLAITGTPSTALTSGQRAVTAPGTLPAGTSASASQLGSNVIGLGNQFATQQLGQDKYNLSLQLAQNLAGQYGFQG